MSIFPRRNGCLTIVAAMIGAVTADLSTADESVRSRLIGVVRELESEFSSFGVEITSHRLTSTYEDGGPSTQTYLIVTPSGFREHWREQNVEGNRIDPLNILTWDGTTETKVVSGKTVDRSIGIRPQFPPALPYGILLSQLGIKQGLLELLAGAPASLKDDLITITHGTNAEIVIHWKTALPGGERTLDLWLDSANRFAPIRSTVRIMEHANSSYISTTSLRVREWEMDTDGFRQVLAIENDDSTRAIVVAAGEHFGPEAASDLFRIDGFAGNPVVSEFADRKLVGRRRYYPEQLASTNKASPLATWIYVNNLIFAIAVVLFLLRMVIFSRRSKTQR